MTNKTSEAKPSLLQQQQPRREDASQSERSEPHIVLVHMDSDYRESIHIGDRVDGFLQDRFEIKAVKYLLLDKEIRIYVLLRGEEPENE